MDILFDTLWRFNGHLSALLCAVLLVRWLLRKSAKIYNAYLLWFFLPLAPISGLLTSHVVSYFGQTSALRDFAAPIFQQRGVINDVSPILQKSVIEQTVSSTNSSIAISATSMFILAWAIICLALLIRLVIQHIKLRNQLNSPEFNRPLNLEQECAFPIQGVSQEGFSPAVYGFFRPKIYFPTALFHELDSQQRRLILQHEVQHIKQGHLWLNLAWDILVCFMWFNPLLYWSRHAFRHDQELFCDYLVLHKADRNSHKAYGHALITTVSATHSVSLLCSWKMFNQLEERILNIKSNHPTRKNALLSLSIASLLVVSSLIAIATADEPTEPDQKASKPNSISIVKINTDDKKQITIKTDDKTYRSEDGDSFIIEGDEQRQLTREEEEKFEKLIEQSVRYASSRGSDRRGIFEFENVHSFTFDHDGEFDIDEFEKRFESMEPMPPMPPEDIKIITMIEGSDGTQRRIERALERAHHSERAAVKKARKKLAKTHKELEKQHAALAKKRELAHQQLKELRELSEAH